LERTVRAARYGADPRSPRLGGLHVSPEDRPLTGPGVEGRQASVPLVGFAGMCPIGRWAAIVYGRPARDPGFITPSHHLTRYH